MDNSNDQENSDLLIEQVVLSDHDDIQDRINKKIAEVNQVNQINFNITNNDLASAELNYNRPLTELEGNPEVKKLISDSLDKYNEKYGTDLSWKTINEYIEYSISDSPEKLKIHQLVTGDLITKTCDYIIFKSIIVASKSLDQLLENIQRKKYQQDVSDELIIILDRIFMYVERFEAIKNKYKVFDIKTSIENTTNTSVKTESQESVDKVNDILNSISKSLLK